MTDKRVDEKEHYRNIKSEADNQISEEEHHRNTKNEAICLLATGSAGLLWTAITNPSISIEEKMLVTGLAACSGLLIFVGIRRASGKTVLSSTSRKTADS